MNLFTVVVTYNAEDYLEGCIGGLLKSSLTHQIIVVDNNSSDKTVQKIRNEYSEVLLLNQTQNLGFGKANNIGMEYALNHDADYIFLLNQDAYVYEDTLSLLIQSFNKSDQSFGIISPIHLNTEGSELDYAWKRQYLTPKTCPSYFNDLNSVQLKEVYPIQFANAAAWMLSSECVRVVGGFNDFFFMYSEDDDYIKRLKYKGFKLGFCPGSKIRHLRFRKINNNKELKTKKYFLRKYFYGSAVLLMDPSNNMLSVFFKLVWLTIKRGFSFLRRGNFREFFFQVWLPFKLVLNWSSIKKHRKESKKTEFAHLFK